MNYFILSAGILATLTSLVHIFAGQKDPIRPFMDSDLNEVPKATLLACWHMVSVMLVFSSIFYLYVGWYSFLHLYTGIFALSLTHLAFSVVFIVVGWNFFGIRGLLKLPQWLLLLPIGLLSFFGTL
ncbi:hypothetical protein [Veronia pacifica]|uniref:Uncharacterized protein n=1 Tax=Veronia pacifica TaxID=1080227 RepID=A0A1C3ER43_9GAMM|nr:hypothetical protein [Veronia pacifica]ODA35713.1 hypothetical protein A8L45_03655 [Veronia pacifica]